MKVLREKDTHSEDISEETLQALLEQNWLHARHVEKERLSFINTYAIIVAAFIGLIGVKNIIILSWPMVLMSSFLLFLSILGIISTYKLSAEFHNHITKIELIVDALKAKQYMGLPLDRTKKGRWSFIRFTIAVYLLFIFVSLGGLGLIIYFLAAKP